MPLDKMKGGAPSNSFLDQVTIKCYYKENGENKPRFCCAMTGCHESWASPCHLKRVCHHLKEECKFVGSGTRATATLMLAGEALSASPSVSTKSKVSGEGSVYAVSKKAHKDALEKELNLKVLWLLCVAMISPKIVDHQEWKDIIAMSNPSLMTFCSTTFSDAHIPSEAALVLQKSLEKLWKLHNLTITYDSNMTKGLQSIYTIHVITPQSREAHLIEGNENSGVSHTGQHIANLILNVSSFLMSSLFI